MCNTAWTPETIKSLLDSNPKAVERAVVAIYRRQTDDERQQETTRHHNNVGYSAFHAPLGSYYAKWVLAGRHLTGRHLERARCMMQRYAGQLYQIIQARQGQESELSHV
jgi:hypothetical protein